MTATRLDRIVELEGMRWSAALLRDNAKTIGLTELALVYDETAITAALEINLLRQELMAMLRPPV